ncbi:MAG: S26 family signal peptidase [Sphingomonadales bacterium]|nr:S26 family signal peptidase [Sphingomonadales bacterium]MBU3991543.1 S26 family signal peptidase [Alphaproteobacteria bacterium]
MIFRWGTLVTMVAAVNVVAISMWINPPPKLIWNASASVPIGFYTVRPASDLRIGDLAVVTPPDDVAMFLSVGGYLPLGVPLIKPVAALPGQNVCRNGIAITIDGKSVGAAREQDRLYRPLPVWEGCRVIAADEIFFMNADRGDSLDGRYFGPLPASSVVGRASPLRTRAPS